MAQKGKGDTHIKRSFFSALYCNERDMQWYIWEYRRKLHYLALGKMGFQANNPGDNIYGGSQ